MTRTGLLQRLLACDEPSEQIRDQLKQFGWDSEEELVVLRPEHVISVLDRYEAGTLTAEQVSVWADAVECRDDVGLDHECEDRLKDVLFRLATPEIHELLSAELARRLKEDLRRA